MKVQLIGFLCLLAFSHKPVFGAFPMSRPQLKRVPKVATAADPSAAASMKSTDNKGAQDTMARRQEQPKKTPMQYFASRFQLGGNYTHASIRPFGLAGFNGNLGGAQGIYEYRAMDTIYAAALVDWKQGQTFGNQQSRFLTYVDAQERIGYSFGLVNKHLLLSFFTGLGYRHMGENLKSAPTTSLKFDYNELYIPTGFNLNYMFNWLFALGADFAWEPQVYPSVKIVPLNGARWILKKPLQNFYAAIPFTVNLSRSQRWSLIIRPNYERWNDGASTAATSAGITLGLPGNTYDFYGIDLSLSYSF